MKINANSLVLLLFLLLPVIRKITSYLKKDMLMLDRSRQFEHSGEVFDGIVLTISKKMVKNIVVPCVFIYCLFDFTYKVVIALLESG